MDYSDPLALNPLNHFTKVKERSPSNEVMACKPANMQRIIQVVQRVAQKSCRRACQLFCCPIETLCERVACLQQPTEDKTTQVALPHLPSTILIVNISNSTLIDCVIGNDTYPSAVAESQPLMRDHHMHGEARCSCSHRQQGAAQTSASAPPSPPPCPGLPPAAPPSISIHGSCLNCVIIGDNNCMHAVQAHSTETEEPQV